MRDKEAQIVSTRQLAEDAAGLVKHVRDSGQAVMVVEDGEPAAVLVTAAEFALLREQRRFLAAIDEGLADVDAGRVMTTDELKQSLEAEFGPIAWQ
jgi:prevent-host-death family protein